MRAMRAIRALAVLGVFAAVTAVAVAAPAREPKKAIKPAVQARAKRISVSLKDLPGFGWKTEPRRPIGRARTAPTTTPISRS